MKTKLFSLFKYNKFEFGNQIVSQFIIFECKYLFSIILFYFHKSDKEQDRYHTHAFNAHSFKIFGKYTEYVLYDEKTLENKSYIRESVYKYFPKDCYHKIGNSTGCLTILFSGKWDKTWKECNDKGEIKTLNWNRK